MKKICGIDDSGRGPVIGPMVLAGVMVNEDQLESVRDIGAKDSKLLSPKKRYELCAAIKEMASGVDIQVLSPAVIDGREEHGLNLNDLEAKHAAEIINVLKPDVAILDCPSNNIPAWTRRVQDFLSVPCELQVEHKADLHHPIVGAASILAKCTRDDEVKAIEKSVGVPIGSGYPSDPVTKKFILEYHEQFPEIFRKSWLTYQQVVLRKGQKSLDEF